MFLVRESHALTDWQHAVTNLILRTSEWATANTAINVLQCPFSYSLGK